MSAMELKAAATTAPHKEHDPDTGILDGAGDELRDLPRAVAADGDENATATAAPSAPDSSSTAAIRVIASDSLSAATLVALSPAGISVVVRKGSHSDLTRAHDSVLITTHDSVPMMAHDSDQQFISDPIEGHDSEFDVELSSVSSIHSGSCTQHPAALTIGIVADESHLDGPECCHDTASEEEGDGEGEGEEEEGNECVLTVGDSAVAQHPTLYGKVVKSIQKSIRRIFHCGRDNLKSVQVASAATTVSAASGECFAGCAACVQQHAQHAQHEVPMTSIQALNGSPITSVLPGVPPPSATLHKTLVIDVAYSTPLLGRPRNDDAGKKCLVLDLDETLVHSTFQPVPNADLVVPVHLGEGVFQPIYVCKRPGVDEFLQAVSGLFEVVLFTASLSNYADPVIDFLDPIGGIRHRLYREDCLQFQGMYIKDLSRLGRDPDQILIIDNSPASYSMQPHAALGCRSWFKDPHDRELQDRILPMLLALSQSPSVSQWRNENLESIETPYCCL